MQNAILPVPRQNDLFDAEPAISLSIPGIPAASEADRSAHASAGTAAPAGRIKVPIKAALLLSLLLHAALAGILCVRPGQTLAPEMNGPLQATWITWADAVSTIEKKHSPAPAPTVAAAPAAAVPSRQDSASPAPAVEMNPVLTSGKDAEKVAAPDDKQAGVAPKTAEAIPSVSPNPSDNNKGTAPVQAETYPTGEAQVQASYTTMAKPRYKENASPVYPPEARLRGQQGVVVLHVEILPEGLTGVTDIKTSSGYASLDRAALDAVRGWKFEPARKRGKPVAVRVDIPVRFVLKKNE